MFDINDFRSQLEFGGARSSLFEVILTNPVDGSADQKLPFMCKAAQLPGSRLNPIPQRYFGREVKFPGNREFDNWTVSIINDEDFKVRNALETWSSAINGLQSNVRKLPSSSPTLYKSTSDVRQFSQTGDLIRAYKFVGLWPVEIEAIQVNWEQDQIQEFQVTFSVDYFYVSNLVTGDGGGI